MVIGTLAETCEYSWLHEDSMEDEDWIFDGFEKAGGAKKVFEDLESIYKKANQKCPVKWADKMLVRLMAFGHKLEKTPPPKDGFMAKTFHKLKTLVGKVIKKLAIAAGRVIGSGKRIRKAGDFQFQYYMNGGK